MVPPSPAPRIVYIPTRRADFLIVILAIAGAFVIGAATVITTGPAWLAWTSGLFAGFFSAVRVTRDR